MINISDIYKLLIRGLSLTKQQTTKNNNRGYKKYI